MRMSDDNMSISGEFALLRYTEAPERPAEGNLMQHAWDELNRAGLFTDKGDFYGGMVGRAVMDLIQIFSEQGHSGMSASIVRGLFDTLSDFKPLGPLTDDPDEWFEHEGFGPDDTSLWQSKRNGEAFSTDGGKTYRLNSDASRTLHPSEPHEGSDEND